MMSKEEAVKEIPLFISSSTITTEINKTGTWRFVRPVYDEKTAPCSAACPAGEDITRIEMLASQGKFKEALETILMENPFPAVCGRVCFHPCENACNRKEFDQGIAIHHLERFIGDMGIRSQESGVRSQKSGVRNQKSEIRSQKSEVRNQKPTAKIAIIGAGPAGLSAAYFLSRLGYECDIFESKSEPGGLLRWGIPGYRLPDDILKSEIDRIISQGVQIYCNHPITEDFLNQAKSKYNAIFMGCGHGKSFKMNIPGEDMAHDGLEFLYNIRKQKELEGFENLKGLITAVIGGGNTAVDVARSLIRLGAKPILIYRRRKQDMPAFAHEVDMALKEGVEIRELLSPVSIEERNGKYILTLQKMKIVAGWTKQSVSTSDYDLRPRVVPDGEIKEAVEVQKIFTAIGAEHEESWYLPPSVVGSSLRLEPTAKILSLSHCRLLLQSGNNRLFPMVFGGDLTNPVKSVTDAIASGKEAAMALDIFFKTGLESVEAKLASCRIGNGNSLSMEIYTNGERAKRNPHTVLFNEINIDYFQHSSRLIPDSLAPVESSISFSEIEKSYSADSAIEEAKRCFNCGICNDCDNCRLFCPDISVEVSSNGANISLYPLTYRCINLDYCKGCGICVVECPRNAISLKEEKI